ncbi:MAG TPA: serine/threonine-protein kinase [Gemmataceae bacterium]|nr:serine/threonine-protein kinase [Gemmataceae bacterium]
MAAAPINALMDDLRRLRLLEPAHLEQAALLDCSKPDDPKTLVNELVRRGWLTSYQGNKLLQGRGKDLVLGAYVLLEPLGEGGMSQVFKARQQRLGRVVALKVLRKERLSNPETVHRFQRELRALAALSHPNIVTAYSADEVRGAHMLVMEYVEGATDLAALVKKNGPLPIPEACEYIRQAALGLQHAHEHGMVHRDVKPHNLLLCAGGKLVKILDLGLARVDAPGGEASGAVTRDGAILGSPDYLSPEQAQEMHTVDIRADLYSLGCTFYYLLTGVPPFPGGTFFDKVYRHRFEEPQPLESLRPDAPPDVGAVVRKLMAKRPEERFGTPAEVAAAVAALLHQGAAPAVAMRPAPAVAIPADAGLDPTTGHGDTAPVVSLIRRRRKQSWNHWLMYTVSACLCLLVGATVLLGIIRLIPAPRQPPKPTEPDNPAPPIATSPPAKLPTEVFQDFESGTYGDWKTTGAAFGDKPVATSQRLPGQQPVSGYGGKYYVNSFRGGDASTGTLTSPEFTIRHSYIRFRIGGGAMLEKEYIALLVGGKKLRVATGRNAEKLEWENWDVRDLKGQKATIEIVDQSSAYWGHINIDDVTFTDEPPP